MTTTNPLPAVSSDKRFWWQHLTGYHWFVFIVGSAAWFFDCLDQRLFSLARNPALSSLMHQPPGSVDVQSYGKNVTACFLIGWGVGGLIFGSLGDKFGRSRMLAVTIAVYAFFTSLCFFSQNWQQFATFRFLTGLGIGGVFGLAVSLIAETVPTAARAQSLGLLQVLSTGGNLTAAFVKMGIDSALPPDKAWRWMFLVGAVPALLVILGTRFIREPERWLQLKRSGMLSKGGLLSPYRQLFSEKRWRRNLIVGALIASTGVVGLWAIGEYAVDLQRNLFTTYYINHGVPAAEVKAHVERAATYAYILNMLGAGTGMWIFTKIAAATGRRFAFLCGFTSALVVTVFVYWKMTTPTDAYWMMPLMGAAQLSVFAGFSIYLPELFGNSVRSTGTSFCYNLGRFAAAGGSFFSFVLSKQVFANGDPKSPLPLRYSAMTMCAIFLIGLAALPFAPETKGKPLPE
jgi:MFS family permease